MTLLLKNLHCLSIVYIRSNSKLFIKTFYDTAVFSSIHILLSSFSIPFLVNITYTHTDISPNIQAHAYTTGYPTQFMSSHVSPLITLTHINFSFLCMLQLYLICGWFYLIQWCSLIPSDSSSKILSSWALSSIFSFFF